MLESLSEPFSWLACRLRGRAALELEVIALRHQLAVLRRQHPGRPRLFAVDRLIWAWLYRVQPRCLDLMVLVKPATVVQWHRQGFRLYWRWRSRSGRPSVDREIRDLIRQMSSANPLWGAPRIHGELLKLGIELSQATVAKYVVRRPGSPSPTGRAFLRNQVMGIAAIDMFVVPSATFRLLPNEIARLFAGFGMFSRDTSRGLLAGSQKAEVVMKLPLGLRVFRKMSKNPNQPM